MEVTNDKLVDRFESESDKIYQERLEFIKNVCKDKNDMKEAIRLSKIWMNFKFKGCRYSSEVYQKIKPYM